MLNITQLVNNVRISVRVRDLVGIVGTTRFGLELPLTCLSLHQQARRLAKQAWQPQLHHFGLFQHFMLETPICMAMADSTASGACYGPESPDYSQSVHRTTANR